MLIRFVLFGLLLNSSPLFGNTISNITGLNPIKIEQVLAPKKVEEIQKAVRKHSGPISIGGGRYSMGGQIASEGALFLDMRSFDKILEFSKKKKFIRVQPGITWRKIQEFIDPYDLSVMIMQSYSNFTVGGSLSVNVHGRYVGLGPIILSVQSIKVVSADGSLVEASPYKNPQIFYGCIGGYGGLGVIVEATLALSENAKVKRQVTMVDVKNYPKWFDTNIKESLDAIFHNGDLYPPSYNKIRSVTWVKTDQPVTIKDRLVPLYKSYWLERLLIFMVSEIPLGKIIRSRIIDPILYAREKVVFRNYEASYDVKELEPYFREKSTYVLQEYFIPVRQFLDFALKLRSILRHHHVNVLNVSIRHALADTGSYLAWAPEEVFSFVLYYKQGVDNKEQKKVVQWTQELIEAAISVGGRYYLPYQIYATPTQFHRAYPRAKKLFALKRKLDPTKKFSNSLWDAYYSSKGITPHSKHPSRKKF